MPKPVFATEFHRVLFDHVHNCSVPEFKTILEKHGQDTACLKVMQDAIHARMGIEDSGDWTSKSSDGWQPTRDKQKALDRYILNRGPRGDFQQAAVTETDLLRQEAARCHVSVFRALLQKHGHDLEKRAALESGMHVDLQQQDPGSWGEPSSYGWRNASEKKDAFEAYTKTLTQPPIAEPTPKSEVESLREEVAALKQRVAKLEARKFKL